MADTTYINGSAALRSFMQGIHSRVNELLDEREINASGRLQRSNRVDLRESVSASTGVLSALSYWRTAGSGSPPGTAVEWTALQRWALDKGLANNERRAGSILNYGKVIVNNWMVLNAPLTSGQRTELYGAGQHAHPWNLSFGSAITHRYDFENDLTDAVGGETLTGVSLDASNYITP